MMNRRQRESASKYLYDLSKIIFATVIIGQILSKTEIHLGLLIGGIIGCLGTYFLAYFLEKKEEQ